MNTPALLPENYLTFHQPFQNLNVSDYLSNPQTCQCRESAFCYEQQSHVITGDLKVIENANLRELVAKAPKYREPIGSTGKLQKQCFWNPLISMKKLSKREQVELKYLSEWKDQLNELVEDSISNLKGHFKSPKCKVVNQTDLKDTSRNYIPIMFWSLRTKVQIM